MALPFLLMYIPPIELARKTVESVLRSYGIIVGKDFKLEVLKRRTPSEIYELK